MIYPERQRQLCFGVHLSSLCSQVMELVRLLDGDFVIIGDEVEALDRSTMESPPSSL
jgi:hypothetical protein